MLTEAERTRYSRHLILPEIGEEGQLRLKESSVLIVGAGGLGSPSSMYLAAAGVGRLGLVDFDVVDATNLHRQILYGESNIGTPKLEAAKHRLTDINPHIDVELHATALTSENALALFARYDVILDGTDNFPTRYLVNDACVLAGKPNVYASIFRFDGQVSIFDAKRGPCYRCLYPEPPPPNLVPSCAEGGVLGVLPGIVGTIQATEAIKLITGAGEPLLGRLLLCNALQMTFRQLKLRKDPGCRICGENPTVTKLIDYQEFCSPVHEKEITPAQLAEKLERKEPLLLLDVREPYEVEMGAIEGSTHIPMQQVPARIDELPRDQDIVVYCKMGGRSARVQQFLEQEGFTRVRNLAGGIQAWDRS